MSGIAKVLLEMGYSVSGSDIKESRNTLNLRKQGATIKIGHNPQNLESADVVVVSSAIKGDNPEVKFSQKKGIPILKRAEMLSELGEGKVCIAVAGTHGKTTTTSLISFIFEKNDLNPTFLIGGELNDIGSNAKYGKGDFFIVEADESDGSLLYLKPDIIVVTNIEEDHLDYFKSLDGIEATFLKFIELLPHDGHLVINMDHPINKKFIEKIKTKSSLSKLRITTYGFEDTNDYSAKNLELNSFNSSFDVLIKGKKAGNVSLKVPGCHNVSNSLAAIAVGDLAGIKFLKAARALKNFSGVKRRFQLVGICSDVTIVDDYAHHPSEVKATLDAAKDGDWGRVICVFQPHRYSRTRSLADEFGTSFEQADMVIITDVYGAGEVPEPGINGKLILDSLLEYNPHVDAVYLPRKVDINDFLSSFTERGDLILTMGAGDIHSVGEDFLSFLIEKNDSVEVNS